MPTYSVLNVAPQSAKVYPYQPAQRRKVTLDDHHQTWLVNYNEIRDEVNWSTSYGTPSTIVYRNDYGNFAANQIAVNSLVLGTPDPNANGATAPVVFNANGITINPPATLDVNGEASFSNLTVFEPGSDTYFEGDLTANGTSTFNGPSIFTGYVNFTPTSTLDVDGPSFFGAPMTITDDVDMTGDFDLTGDFVQTGNSVINGNLEIGDDLLVRGNLTVLGDNVTLEIQNLVVEDKNIVVNKNDVFNNTFETGIWIQKGTVANAGYLQVSSYDEGRFEFKPPGGNKLTIEMPVKDVLFRLDDDFASDQALLTTSNVAFRTIVVDTSFGRHGGVPSYTQQNDPIAKDFGWISTPWAYTNAVESSENLFDGNTTGLFMGATTFTTAHELSLVTYGEQRIYIDDVGQVGFNTINPVHNLHLSDVEPTFLISTDNYTEKAILALSDFAEDYDSSGMYLSFDANTGTGLLEVTPFSFDTTFSVSVGGYLKNPELIVRQDKVTVDTDLYVTENGYVDKEFIVDSTLYVRTNLVGVNVINPAHALDVSGDIHGDSDLILDGMEPFAKIGTVTTLENVGRSGLIIEEETPIIQLSTNAGVYRHGSQLYWNDAINDQNWSIGSVRNGEYLDFGKSFGHGANTPEHGLDEYEGETLFRLNGANTAEFYVTASNTDAGMKLNTRNNGVHLYLGEQTTVLSGERSTVAYGQNDFSSVVQWHGSGSTVGEVGYFPNGNDDGEFGSFRFSRTDGTVNQSVPSAKVGANQFYANDKIAVSQTTPTSELHITKDVASALIETEDSNSYIRLLVDDATGTANIRGENVTGTTYFQFQAVNPASFDLVSGNFRIFQIADDSQQNISIGLQETITPSEIRYSTGTSNSSFSIDRNSTLIYDLILDDSNNTVEENKETSNLQHLITLNNDDGKIGDLKSSSDFEVSLIMDDTANILTNDIFSSTLVSQYKQDIANTNIFVSHGTPLANVDLNILNNSLTEDWIAGNYQGNLIISAPTSTTKFNLYNAGSSNAVIHQVSSDAKFYLENTNNKLQFHNEPTGNSSLGFSGYRYTLKHTDPTDKALYNAYRTHIDIMVDANFDQNVNIAGDLVVANTATFLQPVGVPNGNHVTFNTTFADSLTNDTGLNNSYVKWDLSGDDYGSIYMSSGGADGATKNWGINPVTVDATRLVFEVGNNNLEGFEFISRSAKSELFFVNSTAIYPNRPIIQTHNDTLFEYTSGNKWLLKNRTENSGIYWNLSGGTYKFTNQLGEYTNAEDSQNQIVFVKSGSAKASVDLDTGSFRTTGDVVADNDIIGFVTSDKQYKDNVENIENALNKIDEIRGVEFDWKENPSGYTGHDVGVIAQEIEKIVPEAVRVGGNGQKQVNYEKLVPLLIQCVKELKDEINILKKV